MRPPGKLGGRNGRETATENDSGRFLLKQFDDDDETPPEL